MVELMYATETDPVARGRVAPIAVRQVKRPYALPALLQARWQLAVATELAEPGTLHLFPVFASRALVDFKFLDVCSAAAAYLGAEPDEFVNRSVTQMLGYTDETAGLIRVYANVFHHGRQTVEVTAGRRNALGSSVLHQVSRNEGGVSVLLTCPDACFQKAAANDRYAAWQALADARALAVDSETSTRLVGQRT